MSEEKENKEEEQKEVVENNVKVPEQLDDVDFEKEKEEKKKLKKEKKAEKKKKKETQEVELDENGNEIPKKKSKKTLKIVIITILILAIVAGAVAAYLLMFMNKPENIVSDFTTYFNNGEWDKVVSSVDFKGFYALYSLESEDYTKFDSNYSNIDNDENYTSFQTLMDTCIENGADILGSTYKGATLKVDSINTVEKIENTDSLYKINANLTFSYNGEDMAEAYDIYVAKIGKEYKLVGGELALMVEYIFEYTLYTTSNSN